LEFPQIEGVLAVYPHFIQLPKLQFCNIVQSCKPQLLSPLSTRSFSRSISKDNWIANFYSSAQMFVNSLFWLRYSLIQSFLFHVFIIAELMNLVFLSALNHSSLVFVFLLCIIQ
jgi:hypothetical protein